MIEKMKKLTFLVTQKEYDGFIAGLREQGVVHVQQLKQGQTSPALQQAMDLRLRYQQALDYLDISLKAYSPLQTSPSGGLQDFSPSGEPEGGRLLEFVEALRAEEVNIRHQIDEAEKNIQRMEPWGNFDWADIRRIEEATDLKVWFYACGSKAYNPAWEERYFTIPVSEHQKRL